jgi:hypothetical protein
MKNIAYLSNWITSLTQWTVLIRGPRNEQSIPNLAPSSAPTISASKSSSAPSTTPRLLLPPVTKDNTYDIILIQVDTGVPIHIFFPSFFRSILSSFSSLLAHFLTFSLTSYFRCLFFPCFWCDMIHYRLCIAHTLQRQDRNRFPAFVSSYALLIFLFFIIWYNRHFIVCSATIWFYFLNLVLHFFFLP